MANECLKISYIVVLCLTIIFAMVELGLAADLVHIFNRSFGIFSSFVRPRARYLVFCSSWTLLSGVVLLILMLLAKADMALPVHIIVLFMSMIFWLIGAALFTSAIGGSGVNCGPGISDCHFVNIVNSTMAFAWINWSFIMIALILALALACFGHDSERKEPAQKPMGTANRAPVSNTPAANDAPPPQPEPQHV